MNRQLQPELLDELPAADSRAIHSRRDLRRINAIMGNARYLAQFLNAESQGPFVEIGAGDGSLSLQVARCLKRKSHARLLDRQPAVTDEILDQFKKIGWSCEIIQADVFDWLAANPKANAIIANLFLHHFEKERLTELLNGIGRATNVFAACEPRRNRFGSFFARNVWLIGCNDVTCHDAEISVRAGFREKEISDLWSMETGWWSLQERPAGLFTHFFGAVMES
jgi:hypothetical protein